MPPAKLILAASVVTVALAACGGGDGDPAASPSPSTTTPSVVPTTTLPSPTESALSKDAWVAEVNKICTTVTDGADAIPDPDTADEYLSAMKALTTLMSDGLQDIGELTPPAGDEADVQKHLVAPQERRVAQLTAALPDLEAAAQADDDAAAEKAFGEALLTVDPDTEAQEKWMTGYGLDECVE
jgi:hypothetical protein